MSYEQDLNTPERHFVGLVSNLASVPTPTAGGVTLGDPLTEPDSYPDQRFAFGHRFNQTDVDDLNTRGAAHGMSVMDALPGDWRTV